MTRLDRRAVLTAVGAGVATSLAGCGLLTEDERTRLAASGIDDALAKSLPNYERPTPVRPSQSAIQAGVERVDELLAAVPTDPTAEDIPNGAIRDRIADMRGDAVAQREAIERADDPYGKLQETRHARRDAAEPAVAYRAVEGEVTLDGIRVTRDALAEDVAADLDAIEYVGSDLDRTLYLAAERESILLAAGRWLDNHIRAVDPSVLDIGEVGSWVEHARAARAVVDHLGVRHRDRVTDARTFAADFEEALDQTVQTIADQSLPERGDKPNDLVDADIGDTPAERILENCIRQLIDTEAELRNRRSEEHLGVGLRRAYAAERDRRAYETIRGRIADGEFRSLDSATAIRDARERAIRLATDAGIDPGEPSIPANMLVGRMHEIRDTDGWIRQELETRDTVYAETFNGEFARYVWVAEQIAALPDAAEAMAARL